MTVTGADIDSVLIISSTSLFVVVILDKCLEFIGTERDNKGSILLFKLFILFIPSLFISVLIFNIVLNGEGDGMLSLLSNSFSSSVTLHAKALT